MALLYSSRSACGLAASTPLVEFARAGGAGRSLTFFI